MDLSQEKLHKISIISYDKMFVSTQHKKFSIPCFISNNYQTATNVNIANISYLITKSSINILIIGSRDTIGIRQQVKIKKIIACDIMNVVPAIHSFNILTSDYRNPGILLLK